MAFDFNAVSAPFRMQPGMRRLAPGTTQLTPILPGQQVFSEKLEVLRLHPGQALLTSPGFDSGPALAALFQQGATEHPQAWRVAPDGSVHAHCWRL